MVARGGMATVYLATDLRLERRVAIKIMHSHLSDDTKFQERFIQEARAAARLSDPNVVNVYDQGHDDDLAYLVMEFLPGVTLRSHLNQKKRLSIEQTIAVMDAMLNGLAAAHRADIVHRDVKPENVLIANDGRVKIGDFGLARATTANTGSGHMLMGTIAYLAPELVTRGSADARSDIYALGIMLYEMLTGEQPYRGEQPMHIAYQHANESVPRPSAKNPAVPPQLDELVLWATEKNPDDRPNNAGVMLEKLKEIERELGIKASRLDAIANPAAGGSLYVSNEFTKPLPETAAAAAAVAGLPANSEDHSVTLRTRTKSRSNRTIFLFVLTLVLAAAAAFGGYWFGSGPGSYESVPELTGVSSFSEAEQLLKDKEFIAIKQSEHSLDVPEGEVMRTDPSGGTKLPKGSEITVVVSLGPAPVTIPPLKGMNEEQVRETLSSLQVNVAENVIELFNAAEPGTVIIASLKPQSSDAAFNCIDGCDATQGDEVTLSISLGPLPNVVGLPLGSAKAELQDAGLLVSDQVLRVHSSEVPVDVVISISERDGGGSWRPGDKITLTVSDGPELFAIPDVTGLTLSEALAQLRDAGFSPDYAPIWDLLPNQLTKVTGSDPTAGSMREKGTGVYLQVQGTS